ncbi:EpsG family protein [Vibrio kanaloae]|uniref:EpsG family protein n=1 Tax=Vibrio kanaloae TaxID=170673 RepID=UPI003551848A
MSYYLIYVLFALVFYCLSFLKESVEKNILVQILLFMISMILGFRHLDIGTDSHSYFKIYQITNSLIDYFDNGSFGWITDTIEKGFVLSISFAKSLQLNYNQFLTVVYLINLNVILYSVRRCNVDKCIVLILFFSTFIFIGSYLNVLRQSIASSFLLISIGLFIDRSVVKAILFLFLGATFHISILAMLPILYISYLVKDKIESSYFLIVIYLSSIVLSFVSLKFNFINSVQSLFVGNVYYNKIIHYTSTSGYSAPIFTFSFLLDSLCIVGILLYLRKNRIVNQNINFLILSFWASLLMYINLSPVGIIAERMYMLSVFIEFYLLVYFIGFVQPTLKYGVKLVLVLSCFIFAFKNYLITATFL